jgi:hypothetical protein
MQLDKNPLQCCRSWGIRTVNNLLGSFLSNKVTKHDTNGFLGFLVVRVFNNEAQNAVHDATKRILILKLDTGLHADILSQAEIRVKAAWSAVALCDNTQFRQHVSFKW